MTDTRHKRRERSDNWDKSRDDDRLTAVLVIKLLGVVQVLLIKEQACVFFENLWPKEATNRVIY